MTEAQAETLVKLRHSPIFAELKQAHSSNSKVLALRKQFSDRLEPESFRALLDCLECQSHFSEKFEEAQRWLLTREAAEQSTPSPIARWRTELLTSSKFPRGLTELGCGLGGDTVFLSQKFEVKAFELDAARAILARANVSEWRQPRTQIEARRLTLDQLETLALFCDPARRGGKRLSRPQDWDPPLPELLAWRKSHPGSSVALKLAPGIEAKELGPEARLYFISLNHQLKECCCLFLPGLPAQQTAVLLRGTKDAITMTSQGGELSLAELQVGQFLHNPDPAILRARALDTLALQTGSKGLHPKIGYLHGPKPLAPEFGDSFRIFEQMSLNWKSLRKALLKMPWTEYEYLGRGVPFSQLDVRKRLPKLRKNSRTSSRRGSVIIFREDGGYRVVLAQREGKNPVEKSH